MFTSFNILETVWTNQINIIPKYMKAIASLFKLFGQFISIEKCGEMIGPLFTIEDKEFLKFNSKLITYKGGSYQIMDEDSHIISLSNQERLFNKSVELANDFTTKELA